MIPLHQTPLGKRYYEVTLPDLVLQIKRLGNALEDIAESLRTRADREENEPANKGTSE